MSAQPVTTRRSRPAARSRRPSRARALRRRLTLAAGLALVVIAVLSLVEPADHAVKEIKLPLRHEDIIRQQAADKNVDPTLIAAVIYTESRFRDQTSHVGAKGLMQIMPETADYIAQQVRRHAIRARRPRDAADQHRLRHLVPALSADEVPREHDPHPGRLQRGRGQGRRVVAVGVEPRREVPRRRPHPVQGDARLRGSRAVGARGLPPHVRSANWACNVRNKRTRACPRHCGYRRHRPHIHPRF